MSENTSDAESNSTKYCGDHVIIARNNRKGTSPVPNTCLTHGYSTTWFRVMLKVKGFNIPER